MIQHITNILTDGRMFKGVCTCSYNAKGTAKVGVAAMLSDHLDRQGMQLSEGRCVA